MNKRKRSKELSKKKDEMPLPNKDKLVKFNISYENLKCFMTDRYPKTDRNRPTNRWVMERGLSPDPSRQAVNLIIEQIQKKGVKCQWNDSNQIEQTQAQVINEEQQYSQKINQAFSQRSSSYGKNSHASTIDRFPVYFTVQYTNYGKQHLVMNGNNDYLTQPVMTCSDQHLIINGNNDYLAHTVMASSEYILGDKTLYYNCNNFEIDPITICHDPRTTLMIRNIPNKYTIQDLSFEIDLNFSNTYDFLYLPCDIKNNCNVGYGFINFLNTDILYQFYQKFHNKRWIKFRSDKICVLTYARLQGLSSLIEHFQNSKVLNHKDKRYKPIIKNICECKKIQSLIKQQKDQQSQAQESISA